MPIKVDRASALSIQDQLVLKIRELITQGALPLGTRLPSSRAISSQLKVSRNTVKIAYSNLMSQGYLESISTSGTFVCIVLPDATITVKGELHSRKYPVHHPIADVQHSYDFSLQNWDTSIAPERAWRRLLLKNLPYRSRHAGKLNTAGLESLREAISISVSPLRGMSIRPDEACVVSSDYRAFDIINKAMLKPNARVCVEAPCDAGLIYLLTQSNATIIPIPVDEGGMQVDQLPEIGADLVYISPTHQQPSGGMLSQDRRRAILEWATRTDTHIVEWDTYGEFCYDETPLPSLFSMDKTGQVIYINSFSGWIGAGLTLGYIAAASNLLKRMLELKPFIDPPLPWLDQVVTADFLSSDGFFGHLRRVRQTFKNRRDALISALCAEMSQLKIVGQKAGRHLVLELRGDSDIARELQAVAADNKIHIQTLYDGYCYLDFEPSYFDPNKVLILGYTAMPEERLTEGVTHLKNIWATKNQVNSTSKCNSE